MSTSRRTVEVESLHELDRRIAGGVTSMAGWRLQGLDLRGRGDQLRRLDPRGALVLGGHLDPDDEAELRRRGALVFPTIPDAPVDPYRPSLYTPEELYDALVAGRSYEESLDARVYAWATDAEADLGALVSQSLHDLAIDDALTEFSEGRRLVGVMGGHDLARGSDDYAAAARLGRALARSGLTVVTGGGPGAMEAANLGAYLGRYDDPVLDQALAILADTPSYRPSIGDWAAAAFEVRRSWPDGTTSLGVPTWFYGHEPPNPFAEAVAKYFKNAIREDVLLHVCRAGIVFLPGRGGTVQEVFQDACENYYASAPDVTPMVLVGVDYWTEELPVWPVLQALAADRAMQHAVHLVDDPDDVLNALAG